jgi:LmbE family N-acetylglucosaminyl deacetylase
MTSIAPHHTTTTGTVGRLVDRLGAGPLTLLAVWAHPDDESLLAGGLLAEIARRGGRVVTVTATAGEHGTADPIADPPAALADRRRGELDAALHELGAGPAIHLGYGDGECDRATERLAAHLVGRIIDRVDPDVILTFGPDGVTGHPDHRAVARWVRQAVADRNDAIPLLTTAAASAWPADGIERLHSIDAFWPGFPLVGRTEADVVVRVEDESLARKLAAISCHASQFGPVHAALGSDLFRDVAAVECYVAANQSAHHHLSQELVPIAA